jgi:ribosomal protein S20
MKLSRALTIGAIALGLVLAIAIGPLFSATTASAQSSQTAPPGIAGAPLWNDFLNQLAAALNIQRATLDSAIMTAGNKTIDNAVQQGTLTQAQGDALKARLQAGDVGVLWGRGHGKGPGKQALANVRQAMLDAAAQKLGITTSDLLTQLRSGQTLAQIVQSKGVAEQDVINAALAAAKTQLDQAVADGSLTQAQADAIYANLQQKGSQLFTPRGRGWRIAPMTPSPSPSSTT